MKKRLLISSVLMSAVLACALGTGTYAWYEATLKSSVSATQSTAEISTSSQTHDVGGAGQIRLTFTGGNASIELTNGSGQTKYRDQKGNDYVKSVSVANQVGTYTIDAEWCEAGAADNGELHASLAGKTVTFEISTSAPIVLLKSATDVTDANRDEDQKLSVTVTVTNNGGLTVTGDTSVYYAVRADETKVETSVTGVITAK
jgi:hypothetical protein